MPRMKTVYSRQAIGLKLPIWMVEWLREQPYPMAQLIEIAIAQTYNLRPPPLETKGQNHDV